MRKACTLTLIAALLLSLVACGSKEPAQMQAEQTVAATVPVTTEPAPVPETTEPTVAPETVAPTTAPTEAATEAPTEAPTEPAQELVDGMRPEFKEAMDAYEAFYDEYIAFMKKYSENPTDFSLLMQYAGMLTKVAEMDEAFNNWDQEDMNNAELKYYLEVNNRVMQKMVDLF